MTSPHSPDQAKTYNRVKLGIGIASSVLSLLLMTFVVLSGLSKNLGDWTLSLSPHRYLSLLLFVSSLGLLQSTISVPSGFLSGFIVEHRYNLSNQSLARWAWEHLKGMLVATPLAALVAVLLYACLDIYGSRWWLPVGCATTLISVVLTRVAPVLILPLFYTFRPVENGTLKDRILGLCDRAGLHVGGIFAFNLSKNTRKANAGFTGIGKSRRIVLGDTLLREFSEEEIETVFAHELGHYYHRHIRTGILVGTLSTFLGLAVTARLYEWSSAALGFQTLTDLGALPLLGIWLSLFAVFTSPVGNAISRRHERQADTYAVNATGNPAAFASALRKIATQNLSDVEPHPLIEFLFYSHPSIRRRLAAVEALARG